VTAIDWLLDSDPSIRWQVMRDLMDAPPDEVAAERAKVAREGWGVRLLSLQAADGKWGNGAALPGWTSTNHTLWLLHAMGIDPADPAVRRAIALVRENVRWEYDENMRYFDGEVEPCINGRTVAIGAYFGEDVEPIVARLLGEQLFDGGWNCEQENGSRRGSFHTTIDVLEGLLEYERSVGSAPGVTAARLRGQEYLVKRRMLRRLSTGEVIVEDRKTHSPAAWTRFSFPTYWHYDLLRGLDYLRAAGAIADERVAEAIDLVESRRDADGRWPLENPHPGRLHFAMDEGEGRPSRWNTLRAMRVLRGHHQA